MKKILFLFFFSPLQTNGQTILKDFILNNAKEIRSITLSDTNYSDFAVIGKAIGNSRVVMIGEQDHGDGATFLAKGRLIKYLHEKLGFKILAFESDFYSLTRGWELLNGNQYSIDSLIQKNVSYVWAKCSQCSDIFEYLKQQSSTSNPLVISGFDNQLMGSLSQRNLINEINSFLDTSNLPLFQAEKTKIDFIQNISSLLQYYKGAGGKSAITTTTIKSFIATINTALNQLTEKYSAENFYIALLKSIKGACRQMIAELDKKYFAADQARDEQMAENLVWLINSQYPQKKIIVWAANSHIMKNYFESSRPPSMGYLVSQKKELKDLAYIIGLTGQSGKSGRVSLKPYNISSPAKNSLEQWINEKQFQYAFVDFKKFRNEHPEFQDTFFMKWIHWQNKKADWTKVYDGVFYIRDMYPCDNN